MQLASWDIKQNGIAENNRKHGYLMVFHTMVVVTLDPSDHHQSNHTYAKYTSSKTNMSEDVLSLKSGHITRFEEWAWTSGQL